MDKTFRHFAQRWTTTVALAAALLLSACAGSGAADADGAAAAAVASPATRPAAPTASIAAPAGAPTPATARPAPAAVHSRPDLVAGPVSLSCRSAADCAIKDVGSCCGYQPRCVNKDSPTHPEQVKAKCAREGRVSTCGTMIMTACECVAGQCAAATLMENDGMMQ